MAYKGFKGVGPLRYGAVKPPKSFSKELVTEPEVVDPLLVEPGSALTPTVEEGVIPSDMVTGRSGHLDEVVISAPSGKNKKTRAEHRLEKTQSKLETSEDTVDGGEKSNRLRRREARLEAKILRQEGKGKKKYARKDKKYWRDNPQN